MQYLLILLQDWIATLRLVSNSHMGMIDLHTNWFHSWLNLLHVTDCSRSWFYLLHLGSVFSSYTLVNHLYSNISRCLSPNLGVCASTSANICQNKSIQLKDSNCVANKFSFNGYVKVIKNINFVSNHLLIASLFHILFSTHVLPLFDSMMIVICIHIQTGSSCSSSSIF